MRRIVRNADARNANIVGGSHKVQKYVAKCGTERFGRQMDFRTVSNEPVGQLLRV